MNLGSTIKVAGGLFPPQLIERIAGGDPTLKGTAPAAYHVDSTNELNQTINRAWAALTGRWASFKAQLERLPDTDRATTLTRDKWLLPLFQELGFGRLATARAIEAGDRTFALSHGWQEIVPIHLVGWRLDLDKRVAGERGAAASAPHGLVQDCLNTDEARLWAFLSNGRELRLLRDHRSLTRQAYVSFDLEAMFDGEQFGAFRLLWLLCHQSRVEGAVPAEFWLERWVTHAKDEGVRALDRLRVGVEEAITRLGCGFRNHRGNEALNARLASGALDRQEYYRQLLKLVYRLIFLFVAEDREMLLLPDPEGATDAQKNELAAARSRFRRLYATKRLRSLAMKRRGGPHDDGWAALVLVMRQLDRGNPALALPALGSFLWSTDPVDPEVPNGKRISRAIPDLDTASIANEYLYAALSALCAVQDGPVRRPVDWSGVQADELGSVYEALMERVPRLGSPPLSFALDSAAGNERKTTGSYYTPSSLVDCLLDSALDPVLDEAAKAKYPEKAILELSVVDPACGSGHFLVAAARRIAHRLAVVRCGGIEPSPPDVQHALRDVVGRCIYGVDLNPMAVELCKVSLWMEAIEAGRPLSFLDGHIRHGNALLGTTPELMAKGIPDEAWEPIEGDDKDVAKRLKKENKSWKQTKLFGEGVSFDDTRLAALASAVEDRDDATRDAVDAKEAAWNALDAQAKGPRRLADLWCAAFVWPKQAGEAEKAAPVRGVWETVKGDAAKVPATTARIAGELAKQYDFFHWHLAFPKVFGKGGFDVVLGNPPYLNQLETDTAVGRGVRRFLRDKFGDVKQPYTDLATLFIVLGQMILRPHGRGVLVHPLSLFAAQDAAPARQRLAEGSAVTALWLTTEHIFPAASVFVCAVTLQKAGSRTSNVVRRQSNAFITADPLRVDMAALAEESTWGELIADLVGVPPVRLTNSRRIRDIAGTTADFRDQFYGLAPFIVEESPGQTDTAFPRLIITGHIDPAECLWGVRNCKFAKKKYLRPRVDLARLEADGLLAAWARGRLTPKIVVATQTRVVEAFADPEGRMINTVPTITVTPNRVEDLWPLLAVLLAPPVTAWAAGRFAGTALSVGAIKMSADQVGKVPLPANRMAWERAAGLVERASMSDTGPERERSILDAAALMCDAYETPREPVLSWWRARFGASGDEADEDVDASGAKQ